MQGIAPCWLQEHTETYLILWQKYWQISNNKNHTPYELVDFKNVVFRLGKTLYFLGIPVALLSSYLVKFKMQATSYYDE